MGLRTVVEPATHGLTLDEAKAYLKVETTDEDTTIQSLIEAARQHVEDITWRAISPRTMELTLERWEREILLPMPPLTKVTSVVYCDPVGVKQTLSTDKYDVDLNAMPGRITPSYGNCWPAIRPGIGAIIITYECGHSSAPQALKQAMMLLVTHWFENRSAVEIGHVVAETPIAVDALCGPHRVVRFY